MDYESQEHYDHEMDMQAEAEHEHEQEQLHAEGEAAQAEQEKDRPKELHELQKEKHDKKVETRIDKITSILRAIKILTKGKYFTITVFDGTIEEPVTLGMISSTDEEHGHSIHRIIRPLINNLKLQVKNLKSKKV